MSSVTSSTSSPSSVLVVTITIAALTTTFTPPATCTEGLLTQLSSPGYQIWLNEPEPVPGTKYSACYPSQFMDGYTSIANSSSSIAPMFSPLVCPEGWITATTWTNGYIACCNSGYLLAPPSTTVDPNRPAYGGTCYSNFDLSQTVTVTAFDNVNVTATADWVASTSGAQAYGHPIDGFMADVVSTTVNNEPKYREAAS
ncbi:hypothetical protein BX600DRAFT_303378 [Xylariales sp. PMI_506]|nr:hypothetical protein BX600DRAFT_303378 [Xylariales sp. PMI_506]